MSDLSLTQLNKAQRLLMTIRLRPVQGDRFQPTGFPSLGAATYQTKDGKKLLVESAQSMANRLEATCWDAALNAPVQWLSGISHVTVNRGKDKPKFLTDSILEAHRLNSPYILNSADRSFLDAFLAELKSRVGEEVVNENNGLISRNGFAYALLKYDVGSLIHGVFLSNKVKLSANGGKPESIAGGRLRLARALSAFIEAYNVDVAASGGVKNDYVNPSGDASSGFGNVPFARDEYVAERVDCHFNLDLAQIRGYGLGEQVERLLILLSLFKVRKLIDGDLRLRTACDFTVDRKAGIAVSPEEFTLPSLEQLVGSDTSKGALQDAITTCEDKMVHTTMTFEGDLKKGKEAPESGDAAADDNAAEESSDQ